MRSNGERMPTRKVGRKADDPNKVVVSGAWAEADAASLEKHLLGLLGSMSGPMVTLDLTRMSRIGSRHISVCIGFYRELEQRGIQLRLVADAETCRLLRMFKLDGLFQLQEGRS